MRPGERRGARRFARRSQVRYWIGEDPRGRLAFIHDISSTGVFIVTPYPVERGTPIRLEVLDGDKVLKFEAVVARRVWIAPDLRKIGPTGMGVRFLRPEELVERLRKRGGGPAPTVGEKGVFRIEVQDDRGLLAAYAKELEQGGLYLPHDDPPPINREVTLEFRLPDGAAPVRATARVVQRVPPGQKAGGLPAGFAVAFANPDELLAHLRPHLDPPSEG